MGYVFISYSSKNLEYADAMRNLLKNIGVKTWMAPGDIPAGSTYAGVITRALKGSDCLVLLLTDDSQKSTWVDKEVERALSYGKTIIPVALESLTLNDNFVSGVLSRKKEEGSHWCENQRVYYASYT